LIFSLILWFDETKIELFGLKASRLEETWHHPFREVWWWQLHAVGGFPAAGTGRLVRIERKMYREILDEKPDPKRSGPQTVGERFTFQQDNNPKHTAKATQELLQNRSLNFLEWPSQSPDLNPIKHLQRDLKIYVQRCSPSNLTELERICREE
jgi:hypothetical protein